MVKASYKAMMQGLYRVLVKDLLGPVLGVLTMAHISPSSRQTGKLIEGP